MQPDNRHFDLIIIGSGIGGLTVASLMAQLHHQRVLLLERHFKLGGFTHSFTRPGHRAWDVGLHYVGGMAAGETGRQLFDLVTRRGVRWQKMASPFEKFVYPDFTFDVPDDETGYRQALIARYPHERAAIEAYFRDLRAVSGWFGAQILAQAVPGIMATLIRIASRPRRALALSTTAAYLDERVRDPQLKAVLASQWGDYGLPPSESAFAIHALVAASYLGGGYYPIGGAGTIARSVAEIVAAHGGQCLVNHRVAEIIVSDGAAVGVRVESTGRQGADLEFTAPHVVSDAGAFTTFCHLVPQRIPIPFRGELARVAAGHGFVTLYLAFKESPARLGFKGENHWIYNGYDHDALFKQHGAVLEGRPSGCYLSFQSLKDPEATTHTAEIIAFLDYASVEAWKNQPWHKRGEDYDRLKDRVADGLLAFVDRHYPGFKALVDYCEVSTPLTVEHFTGHLRGSVYGIPATPERFRLPYLSVATPVRHLNLTGADVGSLGIMGAMMGGVATAARLLGPLGLFRIMAAARTFAAREPAAPPLPAGPQRSR
jgi:phytoene dehydrogenase-like protein